jgi:hypothetical protein
MTTKRPKRLIALTHNRLVWFSILISIVTISCDTLEKDAIENQSEIELKEAPIVVSPQNSGVIDLNSLVKSATGNHTFSVTTQPRIGTLEAIDEFLLKYTPNNGITEGTDSFVLSVFGNENIIIGKDTIFILIVSDSTQLPCGVYALDDHLFLTDSAAVVVDVLVNDTACGVDESLLVVTLLDQEVNDPVSVGASYGSTEVLAGGKIRYVPNATFEGQDRFMYKITKPADVPNAGDPEESSIATVYIAADVACTALPIALPDTFAIPYNMIVQIDTLTFDTVYYTGPFYLDVTGNDFLCTNDYPSLEVIRAAGGIVDVSDGEVGFKYTLPIAGMWSGFYDNFRYRMCTGSGCDEAEVVIKIE